MTSSKATAVAAILVLLSASSPQAAEKFDIDLQELRPAVKKRAASGQQGLEIDLKELKKGGAAKSKTAPKRKKPTAGNAPKQAAQAEDGSYYTMQRGDHLALVLVRHYGMNEIEARRLMPEIMRLNAIASPQRVAVGQRLFIPLPVPGSRQLPQPLPPAADAPLEVVVGYTDACSLAGRLPEKLGLALAAPSIEAGGRLFGVRHDDLSLHVACAVSRAELITYQRLLAMKDERLLIIDNNDTAAAVVEKLAEELGLSYRLKYSAGHDQEYQFTNPVPGKPDLHLIIKREK